MRSHEVRYEDDIIVLSIAEMHHFQHERVTDFKKMFQDMLTTQISFYSNVSRVALHFTLLNAHLNVACCNHQLLLIPHRLLASYKTHWYWTRLWWGCHGVVSNHGYSPNHDIPGHPGTDLHIIIIVTLLKQYYHM